MKLLKLPIFKFIYLFTFFTGSVVYSSTANTATQSNELYRNVTEATSNFQVFLDIQPDCYPNGDFIIVNVEGGTPPFTYNLLELSYTIGPSQNFTEVFANIISGTYTIEVTDDTLTTVTKNITVVNFDEILFDTVFQPITASQPGSLEATNVAGGFPGVYLYELRAGNEIITSAQTSPMFTVVDPGVYYIVAIDEVGCTGFGLEYVFELPAGSNPVEDIATEVLNCTATGLDYPVVTISDPAGVTIDLNFPGVLSIIWEQLDEVSCTEPLDENCPLDEALCVSDWVQVATGSSYVVTEGGEYRIIVQFTNTKNTSETYYYRSSNILNIPELNAKNISLSPNPASSIVHINTPFDTLSIFDISGKEVLQTNVNSFDISSLRSGMYFVQITSGSKIFSTQKLIKM